MAVPKGAVPEPKAVPTKAMKMFEKAGFSTETTQAKMEVNGGGRPPPGSGGPGGAIQPHVQPRVRTIIGRRRGSGAGGSDWPLKEAERDASCRPDPLTLRHPIETPGAVPARRLDLPRLPESQLCMAPKMQ